MSKETTIQTTHAGTEPSIAEPELTNTSSAPPRRPHVYNHPDTCTCKACTSIASRIARGLGSKEEVAAAKRAAKAAVRAARTAAERSQQRKIHGIQRKNAQDQRIATVAGVVAGQIAAGVVPNASEALRIAGVDPGTGGGKELMKKAQAGIEAALTRAGISDDLISQKILEGMNATETRLVIHQGEVKDAIELPDFHARHKFVTVAMQAKGQLKPEQESVQGGLIIISHQSLEMIPGHSATCQCDECVKEWERRAHDEMLKQMKREAITIEHSIIPETKSASKSDPAPASSAPASEPSEPSASESSGGGDYPTEWEDEVPSFHNFQSLASNPQTIPHTKQLRRNTKHQLRREAIEAEKKLADWEDD